jgi:hypothetical protein
MKTFILSSGEGKSESADLLSKLGMNYDESSIDLDASSIYHNLLMVIEWGQNKVMIFIFIYMHHLLKVIFFL